MRSKKFAGFVYPEDTGVIKLPEKTPPPGYSVNIGTGPTVLSAKQYLTSMTVRSPLQPIVNYFRAVDSNRAIIQAINEKTGAEPTPVIHVVKKGLLTETRAIESRPRKFLGIPIRSTPFAGDAELAAEEFPKHEPAFDGVAAGISNYLSTCHAYRGLDFSYRSCGGTHIYHYPMKHKLSTMIEPPISSICPQILPIEEGPLENLAGYLGSELELGLPRISLMPLIDNKGFRPIKEQDSMATKGFTGLLVQYGQWKDPDFLTEVNHLARVGVAKIAGLSCVKVLIRLSEVKKVYFGVFKRSRPPVKIMGETVSALLAGVHKVFFLSSTAISDVRQHDRALMHDFYNILIVSGALNRIEFDDLKANVNNFGTQHNLRLTTFYNPCKSGIINTGEGLFFEAEIMRIATGPYDSPSLNRVFNIHQTQPRKISKPEELILEDDRKKVLASSKIPKALDMLARSCGTSSENLLGG